MDLKPSNVTAETLERVRTETSKDPVLSILNSVTMTGWPDERKSVPEEIRGFWSYREEVTADNGVLFKLDQVIVLSSLRAEMLRKIHKAHQGYDSSIRSRVEFAASTTPSGQQSPCSHTRYPHVPGQR